MIAAAILEVFYAPICVPCRLELPALAAFAKSHDGALHIVIVNDVPRSQADLRSISPALSVAATPASDGDPRKTLRAAGDTDGILPYARSLTSDGKICASWRGVLTVTRATNMLTACARVSGPNSPRS